MSTYFGPKIKKDGLVLLLDSTSELSYPTSGSTWYDTSGNNNELTLNNVSYTNKSFSFNGTTSYAIDSTFSTAIGSTMSIFMWVYYVGNGYIFTIGRRPATINGEMIFQIISGKLNFWDYDGSYGFQTTDRSNTTITTGWHYVGFTKNGTQGIYYLDGVADGEVTALQVNSYITDDVVIGCNYRAPDTFFNGYVNNVTLYNITLTGTEIMQNYNNYKYRFNLS